MNPKPFVLLAIALGVFAPGLSYAAQTSAQPPGKDSRGVHSTSLRPGAKDMTRTGRPLLNSNSRVSSKNNRAFAVKPQTRRPPAARVYRQGMNTPWAAPGQPVKGGDSVAAKPARNGVTASLPAVPRSGGAGAASIGGATTFKSKNSAGALTGTAAKRRPNPYH